MRSYIAVEDAIEIYNPERPFTMYAKSKDEKKLWLQALNEALTTQFSKPAAFQLTGMPRLRPDISKNYYSIYLLLRYRI